jgi:hypothetical protein
LEEFAPTLASLDEELSKQALDLSRTGLTEDAKDLFRNEFKALAGNQVSSGIGADFVARNLVREQLGQQQLGRNLGLSLQGKVPVGQAFQQPGFNVAGGFAPSFATQTSGFGSIYQGAMRPIATQGNDILGGVGAAFQGLGALGAVGLMI